MRVDKLYLKDFRNLSNFEIDFDEDSPRTVLIGRNGVGKTNLLEALTRIFRQLDLRERPDFEYKIQYSCSGHVIQVEATRTKDKADKIAISFKVAAQGDIDIDAVESISESAFYRLNDSTRLLPKHVFGYYSGASSRFRNLFSQHTEIYRDQLIAGEEDTIRPLFLAEDWHSQFVLLAFYSKRDPEIDKFLKSQFGITGLESVLFALNEPYWYKKEPSPEVRARGDERYWWAAGTVKTFLGKLHDQALAPMETTEKVPVGIRRTKTKEHRYCYIKSHEDLIAIAHDIDQKEFFKRLESTVMSDLLREVKIRFHVENQNSLLSFDDLSEGEQQLLTVLGLLRFTNQDESLFLLDEPDTHLNPAWCLDYLDILTNYGGGLNNSQIIMTTHSPLVFAGLKKNEVILLQKREIDAEIYAEHPASDPKGMGFSAILTSEFFGLRMALDRETTDLLDEKRRLGSLEYRSPKDEERLAELNKEIGELDFSNEVRDPLYKDFVRAMTDLENSDPEIGATVLTPDAVERRRELAKKILSQIKNK
ncbi:MULTISPECIES: AAA family ATPase [Burkholderia]|uniref:AAA family ATPase n=1 Tax=Burkholderia sola TaxID=2843302 RepID=A0ABV2CF20_9BURK|nr:AAA family ATPase [Burkholderia sp. CpTa8-5]MBP0609743.1 AAA family ATPase [Burkholderia sp. CpTa8-5]